MTDLNQRVQKVFSQGVSTANEANALIVELWNEVERLREFEPKKKKRTSTQNAAMHKYFELMSEALNDAGFSYKEFVELIEKNGNQVEWTESNFKETGWRLVQKALFNKESTTELETHEVTQVYEVINRRFAELAGVSMEFPNWRG